MIDDLQKKNVSLNKQMGFMFKVVNCNVSGQRQALMLRAYLLGLWR